MYNGGFRSPLSANRHVFEKNSKCALSQKSAIALKLRVECAFRIALSYWVSSRTNSGKIPEHSGKTPENFRDKIPRFRNDSGKIPECSEIIPESHRNFRILSRKFYGVFPEYSGIFPEFVRELTHGK